MSAIFIDSHVGSKKGWLQLQATEVKKCIVGFSLFNGILFYCLPPLSLFCLGVLYSGLGRGYCMMFHLFELNKKYLKGEKRKKVMGKLLIMYKKLLLKEYMSLKGTEEQTSVM